jgi:hypothetical protein
MEGAEVAVNCLCSVRSCPTSSSWCPDSELADAHRGECKYRTMAEVMEELDAERDVLLDAHDELVGLVESHSLQLPVSRQCGNGWQTALQLSWPTPQ